MKSLECKIPPILWLLDALFCMWATSALLPQANFELPYHKLFGSFFALLGISTALAGVYSFRSHSTTVNPLSPERASSLVTGGPYQYTRNPMYLGMLFILLGWYLVLSNALASAFLVTFTMVMTRLQILPEERALLANFGPEYASYLRTVNRWLGRNRL